MASSMNELYKKGLEIKIMSDLVMKVARLREKLLEVWEETSSRDATRVSLKEGVNEITAPKEEV